MLEIFQMKNIRWSLGMCNGTPSLLKHYLQEGDEDEDEGKMETEKVMKVATEMALEREKKLEICTQYDPSEFIKFSNDDCAGSKCRSIREAGAAQSSLSPRTPCQWQGVIQCELPENDTEHVRIWRMHVRTRSCGPWCQQSARCRRQQGQERDVWENFSFEIKVLQLSRYFESLGDGKVSVYYMGSFMHLHISFWGVTQQNEQD